MQLGPNQTEIDFPSWPSTWRNGTISLTVPTHWGQAAGEQSAIQCAVLADYSAAGELFIQVRTFNVTLGTSTSSELVKVSNRVTSVLYYDKWERSYAEPEPEP